MSGRALMFYLNSLNNSSKCRYAQRSYIETTHLQNHHSMPHDLCLTKGESSFIHTSISNQNYKPNNMPITLLPKWCAI